jgi:hypothetical protein
LPHHHTGEVAALPLGSRNGVLRSSESAPSSSESGSFLNFPPALVVALALCLSVTDHFHGHPELILCSSPENMEKSTFLVENRILGESRLRSWSLPD